MEAPAARMHPTHLILLIISVILFPFLLLGLVVLVWTIVVFARRIGRHVPRRWVAWAEQQKRRAVKWARRRRRTIVIAGDGNDEERGLLSGEGMEEEEDAIISGVVEETTDEPVQVESSTMPTVEEEVDEEAAPEIEPVRPPRPDLDATPPDPEAEEPSQTAVGASVALIGHTIKQFLTLRDGVTDHDDSTPFDGLVFPSVPTTNPTKGRLARDQHVREVGLPPTYWEQQSLSEDWEETDSIPINTTSASAVSTSSVKNIDIAASFEALPLLGPVAKSSDKVENKTKGEEEEGEEIDANAKSKEKGKQHNEIDKPLQGNGKLPGDETTNKEAAGPSVAFVFPKVSSLSAAPLRGPTRVSRAAFSEETREARSGEGAERKDKDDDNAFKFDSSVEHSPYAHNYSERYRPPPPYIRPAYMRSTSTRRARTISEVDRNSDVTPREPRPQPYSSLTSIQDEPASQSSSDEYEHKKSAPGVNRNLDVITRGIRPRGRSFRPSIQDGPSSRSRSDVFEHKISGDEDDSDSTISIYEAGMIVPRMDGNTTDKGEAKSGSRIRRISGSANQKEDGVMARRRAPRAEVRRPAEPGPIPPRRNWLHPTVCSAEFARVTPQPGFGGHPAPQSRPVTQSSSIGYNLSDHHHNDLKEDIDQDEAMNESVSSGNVIPIPHYLGPRSDWSTTTDELMFGGNEHVPSSPDILSTRGNLEPRFSDAKRIEIGPHATGINPWDVEINPNPVIFPHLNNIYLPVGTIEKEAILETNTESQTQSPQLYITKESALRYDEIMTDQITNQIMVEEGSSPSTMSNMSGIRANSHSTPGTSIASPEQTAESCEELSAESFSPLNVSTNTEPPTNSEIRQSQLRCADCHNEFTTEQDFVQHRRRRKCRRFACTYPSCQAKFCLKADLRRHERTVHNVMPAPTPGFVCRNPGCSVPNKVFPRKDNFMRHLRRCGNESVV